MKQQKTTRERAEQALRHMPVMLTAREAAIVFVEREIRTAISDTLEEAAQIVEGHIRLKNPDVGQMVRSIAASIRALKGT